MLGVVGSSPAAGTNKISSVDRNRYFALSFHTDCPNGRTRFRFLPGFPSVAQLVRARINLFAFSPARVAIEWVT